MQPTDPPKAYPSALNGHYLVRKYWPNKMLGICDFIVKTFVGPWIRKRQSIALPKRILLSNCSQLGDVIMMTALLPAIKDSIPDVHLGVVVGSWARPIVENHPLIDSVHYVDHWKQNRKQKTFWQRYREYKASKARTVQELKTIKYDVAVDLCYYFPNLIPLLWKAQIPVRIGYPTGGMGPLLTHCVPWRVKHQSAAKYFLELLNVIHPFDPALLKTTLSPVSENDFYNMASKYFLESRKYLVIHMGSGNGIKEWPSDKWRELTSLLVNTGHRLIFTGVGDKENSQIEHVIADLPSCVNLCNQVTWHSLMAVLKHAHLVVGVDTSIGHAAGALETASILLYTGINPLEHWSPYTSNTHIFMNPVSCYPCYRMNGCATMSCLLGISVNDVFQLIKKQSRRPIRIIEE